MARTILKEKTALVLGVESAPGRACAQQLAREGVRVLLASTDKGRLDRLGSQLASKGAKALEVHLSGGDEAWREQLVDARRQVQHIHFVINALALCYPGNDDPSGIERARGRAAFVEQAMAEDLGPRGPLRIATLWPGESGEPHAAPAGAWRSLVRLGAYQRLDTDAEGTELSLRAGAIGDAVLCLLLLPPSACPARVDLEAVRPAKD